MIAFSLCFLQEIKASQSILRQIREAKKPAGKKSGGRKRSQKNRKGKSKQRRQGKNNKRKKNHQKSKKNKVEKQKKSKVGKQKKNKNKNSKANKRKQVKGGKKQNKERQAPIKVGSCEYVVLADISKVEGCEDGKDDLIDDLVKNK